MGKLLTKVDSGEPLKGPVIPRGGGGGAMVEYHPISARDQSRQNEFGKKVLPELFFGYVLIAGGIWKGGILVADIEELENMDASQNTSSKNQCKRSVNNTKGRIFHFPISSWYSKSVSKRPRIP